MGSRTTFATCMVLATGGLAGLVGCSDESPQDKADAAGVDNAPPSSAAAESDSASTSLSEFSDSFDDDHNRWALPPTESGTTTVAGGDFVWEMKQFGLRPHTLAETIGIAFDEGRLDMKDVRVASTMTPERGGAAMGVFCREVPDTDADFQWYEFVVRDGYAAIRLSDLAHVQPLATSDAASVTVGQELTVEGDCVDQADGSALLTLILDGTPLVTATVDEPLPNGGAGLTAYDAEKGQADEPLKIAWHDFSVEQAG
jgi:hypothetical protein